MQSFFWTLQALVFRVCILHALNVLPQVTVQDSLLLFFVFDWVAWPEAATEEDTMAEPEADSVISRDAEGDPEGVTAAADPDWEATTAPLLLLVCEITLLCETATTTLLLLLGETATALLDGETVPADPEGVTAPPDPDWEATTTVLNEGVREEEGLIVRASEREAVGLPEFDGVAGANDNDRVFVDVFVVDTVKIPFIEKPWTLQW